VPALVGDPAGFHEFFAGVGAIAMGRRTYEWIGEHTTAWPYGDVPTYVLSASLPPGRAEHVTVTPGPVLDLAATLRDGEGTAWLVGGAVRDRLLARPTLDTDLVVPPIVSKEARVRLDTNSYSVPPDYVGKAVPVPAGSHEVQLRFQPQSWAWGLWLGLMGLLLLIASFVPKRTKESEADCPNSAF